MSKNKTLAEQFQEECHFTCEKVLNEQPEIQYQDAVNVWMFNKLAEFKTEINELKFRLSRDGESSN